MEISVAKNHAIIVSSSPSCSSGVESMDTHCAPSNSSAFPIFPSFHLAPLIVPSCSFPEASLVVLPAPSSKSHTPTAVSGSISAEQICDSVQVIKQAIPKINIDFRIFVSYTHCVFEKFLNNQTLVNCVQSHNYNTLRIAITNKKSGNIPKFLIGHSIRIVVH